MKTTTFVFHLFLFFFVCICVTLTNAQCDNCMGGMPMNGCPDPSYCGFPPIKCNCTVPGSSGCPMPNYCTNVTCDNCHGGMPMDGCPDPKACGYEIECIDCMCGMSMSQCVNATFCGMPCGSHSCSMAATFGVPDSVCVLFSSWDVHSASSWAGVIFAIFGVALFRELLIVFRQERILTRHRKTSKRKRDQDPSTKSMENNSSLFKCTECVDHFGDSLYYTVSLLLAYALMLIIMTYHVGLFFAVIGLTGLANFICTYGLTLYHKHVYPKQLNPSRIENARGLLVDENSISNVNAPIRTASDPCCADLEFNDDF